MTPPCSAPLSSIWNVSPADLDAVIYNQTLRAGNRPRLPDSLFNLMLPLDSRLRGNDGGTVAVPVTKAHGSLARPRPDM